MSKKTFITYIFDGFFFVFGLSENPIHRINRKFSTRDDNDAISGYWHRVGKDVKRAYDVKTQQACPEA
jgi:hypothetical protein